MNEFFVILHRGHTDLAIFAIDVVMFVVLAIVLYALEFLLSVKIRKFLNNTGLDGSIHRFLSRKKGSKKD